RPRRRWLSAIHAGPTSRPPATSSTRAARSATSTPNASSAPNPHRSQRFFCGLPRKSVATKLEEGLALTPVCGDDVDDRVAFDQVQDVEALAELAGLGVAHVDAVADPQLGRGRPAERRLDLAGALLGVEAQPLGQPGGGEAPRIAAARGEVA